MGNKGSTPTPSPPPGRLLASDTFHSDFFDSPALARVETTAVVAAGAAMLLLVVVLAAAWAKRGRSAPAKADAIASADAGAASTSQEV